MKKTIYNNLKKNNVYTRSFNYTGNKYKVLPYILPLMPSNINKFYDLFCGSGVVGLNVNAKHIILNDIDVNSISLLKYFYEFSYDDISAFMENHYPTTKEKFLELKQNINHPLKNYLLIKCSFLGKGNTYRFALHKEFTKKTYDKYLVLNNLIKSKNIEFLNVEFNQVSIEENKNNYVYLDPPYVTTSKTYKNDFNIKKQLELINFLENLNARGVYFGMSCMLFDEIKVDMFTMKLIKKNKFIVYVIDLITGDILQILDIDQLLDKWIENYSTGRFEMFVTNYKP